MSNKIKIKQINANGYTFDCRTCGLENSGELIVFLHGWPESSIIYENLIQSFAQKGYRCLAPNQRGYSEGARPIGMEHYTRRKLASDVIELVAAVGNPRKFHLVGHDWGSAVGWVVTTLYPDRIQSWTSMSIPYLKEFLDAVENDEDQHKKSYYIYSFLTPDAPEAMLSANDCERLKALWAEFSEEMIADLLCVFRSPGAIGATLNWYRALMLLPEDESNPPIPYDDVYVPTLFLWGIDDTGIGRASVDKGHKYIKGEYKFVQLKATHWLMQSFEDECSKEIIDHIEKFKIK